MSWKARVLVAVTVGSCACTLFEKPDSPPPLPVRGEGWTSEWRVDNRSDDSLEVLIRLRDGHLGRVVVGGRETQILRRESCFLCERPSIVSVSCVAAYGMNGQLRFEKVAGETATWLVRDIGANETQLTLQLLPQDLSAEPIFERCVFREALAR